MSLGHARSHIMAGIGGMLSRSLRYPVPIEHLSENCPQPRTGSQHEMDIQPKKENQIAENRQSESESNSEIVITVKRKKRSFGDKNDKRKRLVIQTDESTQSVNDDTKIQMEKQQKRIKKKNQQQNTKKRMKKPVVKRRYFRDIFNETNSFNSSQNCS